MSARPWATPELTSLNRLPMHSVPHDRRLPLDGPWQFQLLAEPEAEPGDQWSQVEVPGCWTMQGFSDLPQYTNVQMPFSGSPPEPPAANPTGLYRRRFDLPAEWLNGRRVVLHVGAAESVLIPYVNGVEVGLSKDSHLAAEFDVTPFVRAGANEIRLRVVKWSDSSYIEDQDQWWHGGITRSVFLYTTLRVHLADVRANAGLADDLAEGTLSVDCLVAFDGAAEKGWTIEANLGQPLLPTGGPRESGPAAVRGGNPADDQPRSSTDIHLQADVPTSLPPSTELPTRADAAPLSRHRTALVGKLVAGIEFTPEERAQWAVEAVALRPPLDGRVVLTARLPNVLRWSAEQPALYPLSVILRSPDGEAVEEARLRVGFRRVEVSGLRLLVNGEAVLIRGVNRHDFDAATGRAVTAESMRADLVLMKRFGFNAVRTSHYPNDPAFLDLTDELGMYVVDEADIESHAFYDQLCDDPRYRSAWVDRVARMVERDKNHASVIAWSLGNESGHGASHDAAAGWVRRYDPSRPLHYEGAIRWNWAADQAVSDITCPMYPPISSLVDHAKSGQQRHPLIMSEYSHSMGNSNGTLAEYWQAIETTDGLQGGFIWEWWDHGLIQRLPDGRTRWAYGGDFGDRPNDSNFCLDGLVWPDRTPKPALEECRALFMPVGVSAGAGFAEGRVVVSNRQDFAGLEWLVARWELLADGAVVRSGAVEIPQIGPGQSAEARLAGWRWPDPALAGPEVSLIVRFATAASQPWAPAGFEIGLVQLELPPQPDPKSAPAPSRGGGRPPVWAIDHQGLLTGDLLATAPRMSLWRAPTDNDRIGGLAQLWRDWGLETLTREAVRIDVADDETTVRAEERTRSGIVITHQQRFRHSPAGGLTVDETVAIPDELTDLARVGIVLETAPGLERARWFGRGPIETYPDRCRGGSVAIWQSTVSEMYVPYVRPQENGGRTDVRWLELSDVSGRGFRLAFDRPLQISASHFRAGDLAASGHDVDLIPRAETIVHFDVAHRGLGTASCGPDTLPRYVCGAGRYVWSWTLDQIE